MRGAGAVDGETGRAPQRVLGLLHVSEVAAEVDHPGEVGLVEKHLTGVAEARLGGIDAVRGPVR